jgi:restriction endonuclease S subunit
LVKDLQVKFPGYAEQQKIGSFFTNLDHLITLHQREPRDSKIDSYKKEENNVESNKGAGTVQSILCAVDKCV